MACLLCFVASHNGHDIGNIDSNTRIQVQTKIKDLMGQVDAKVVEFEENLRHLNEIEQDKTKESISLKEEINKSFDSLVAAIEARRAALVKEVEAASVKDLKEIWAQKEVVETSITASRGALALATRSLQCTNDLELLLLGAQINKQLKELSEKNWDPTSITSTEATSRQYVANTPFGISKLGQIKVSTKQLTSNVSKCVPRGEYLVLPDKEFETPFGSEPSSFLVSFETATFKLGVPISFDIKLNRRSRGKKKNPLSQPNVRVLHGKSKVDIPHLPSVVADKMKGTWSVSFTPVVSGEHVIVVEATRMGYKSVDKTESTITVTGEPSIGAVVQRGPDWDYGDEDGGKGYFGTLKISILGCRFIVNWNKPGIYMYNRGSGLLKYNYRWGDGNNYDLQLVLFYSSIK